MQPTFLQALNTLSLTIKLFSSDRIHRSTYRYQTKKEDYETDVQTDPKGPLTGKNYVVRGGGWFTKGLECRSACRQNFASNYMFSDLGFRLVCDNS